MSRTVKASPYRWYSREDKLHRKPWWRKHRHEAKRDPEAPVPRKTSGWLTH